eukprot:SAG11_NODE_6087_length_1391_cov_1.074303_1_plen_337_part_10
MQHARWFVLGASMLIAFEAAAPAGGGDQLVRLLSAEINWISKTMVAATADPTTTVAAAAAFKPGRQFGFEFMHGVASGDPLPDAIVLWTRATPTMQQHHHHHLDVVWEIATTPQFDSLNATGVYRTAAFRDWTVKPDVHGLVPGVRYYYRFHVGDARTGSYSRTGMFKLPPRRGDHLAEMKYAVFSCANWRFGHFNAYATAAKTLHGALDFWVHLGDFYYEYGSDHYPDPPDAVREGLDPPHEAVTLEDYRRRHAQYRLEQPLQALAASAPLIATWDDHEIANDLWSGGAQNHGDPMEGDFGARQLAATQAYREWMPIRGLDEAHPFRLQRKFEFGD